MEEIFKGLVERAQYYYEQFESYRYTSPSEHFGDMAALKLKAPAMSIT